MAKSPSPFHRGERESQTRLGIRDKIEVLGRRMISDHMSADDRAFFSRLPLLFLGTTDEAGRPWVSVLAGRS
jgi:predicted pyridoxine 5'-phosphate oxidase superfamily flavin-nucleotide-binding protein